MRQTAFTFVALPLLWLTAASGLHAQTAGPLTAADHLEIQQLATQFAIAVDTRAGDGQVLATLFTADGELVAPRGRAAGRDELAALAGRGAMTAERPVVDVSHFSMNHVIRPSAEGATGREYVVLVNFGPDDRPGGEFSNIGGHYEDTYVRTPDGWRFRRREYFAATPPPQRPQPTASAAAITAPPATSSSVSAAAPLTADDYVAIRALVNGSAHGLDTGPGGRLHVRHFLMNHLIEASPEGARGKAYVMVFELDGSSPATASMGGHLEDVYEKTGSGWRIKSRRFFRSKSAQTLKAEAEAAATAAPPPQ